MVELPPRQRQIEPRRLEDVAWRENVRAEDVAWRETVRAADLSWREKVRAEDVAWREKVRAEEVAWREKVRAADRVERDAVTSQNKQCLERGLAFIAAAQIAKAGTPTEELVRMALDFTHWIGGTDGTKDKGT